jgi:HAD superfamily hydrolase (TIGR01509 family)
VNTEELVIGIERDHLARIGLDYNYNEFVTRFTGLSEIDFYKALDEDHQARLGGPLPVGFEQAVDEAKWALFEVELKAIDGVADFALSLMQAKAVASSAPTADLIRRLNLGDLHGVFEPHVYSTQLVTNGKPAPDIYLYAANKLNCVAADCVVIEDSVNGVKGGVAAGMAVWGFTGGGHADPGLDDRLRQAGAANVFDSFAAIGQHLGEH